MEIYLFSIRNILLEHLYRTIFKCYHPDLILYQLQCESPSQQGRVKYKKIFFHSSLCILFEPCRGIYEEQIIKPTLRILGQLDFICIFFFVILILSAYTLEK